MKELLDGLVQSLCVIFEKSWRNDKMPNSCNMTNIVYNLQIKGKGESYQDSGINT